MPVLQFKGKKPLIPKSAFVDPSALIIGDVKLGENVSIWANVVIRGDANTITIGANSNIQENCTLHTPKFSPMNIGENVSIGHNAVIHCTKIGNNTLVGMSATILNLSEIGSNCIIGAGSVVTESKKIPDNKVALGVPTEEIRDITSEDIERIERNCKEYLELKEQYTQLGRNSVRL